MFWFGSAQRCSEVARALPDSRCFTRGDRESDLSVMSYQFETETGCPVPRVIPPIQSSSNGYAAHRRECSHPRRPRPVVSSTSRGDLLEVVHQALVEHFARVLSTTCGVVTLLLEPVLEFNGGGEEATPFADGLEAAVEVFGACAPTVAEHAPVLGSDSAHHWSFSVGAKGGRSLVEGLDLGRDGLVLVRHGPVGDAGIAHRHAQAAMPEQRGDGLEAHASVHGLGGEGVT